MKTREMSFEFTVDGVFVRRLLILALLAFPLEIGSESLTVMSSYPAASAVYNQMVTTGGTAAAPLHTVLARGGGNVGIGVAAPAAKLDVSGGYILVQDSPNIWPTTGSGLEVAATGSAGYVQSYNRAAGWMPMNVQGNGVTINSHGSPVNFIATAPPSYCSGSTCSMPTDVGVSCGVSCSAGDTCNPGCTASVSGGVITLHN